MIDNDDMDNDEVDIDNGDVDFAPLKTNAPLPPPPIPARLLLPSITDLLAIIFLAIEASTTVTTVRIEIKMKHFFILPFVILKISKTTKRLFAKFCE